MKTFLGISYLATAKNVSEVGIGAAVVGYVWILLLNAYTMYILIKARNRFKRERIVDLVDLGVKLYG